MEIEVQKIEETEKGVMTSYRLRPTDAEFKAFAALTKRMCIEHKNCDGCVFQKDHKRGCKLGAIGFTPDCWAVDEKDIWM